METDQLINIVDNITLPHGIQLKIGKHPEGRVYLQIYQESVCNRTGAPYNEGGRKWDISKHMTESEVVFTIWKALLTFIEHELREKFMYMGKRIFDPHIDVQALLSVCDQKSVRDEKT